MKYCVIGIGNLGSAIAGTMVLTSEPGTEIIMFEPHSLNRSRAKSEFWDILPVAKDRDITLRWSDRLPKGCTYIITSGVPRKDSSTPKEALFGQNIGIVLDIVAQLKPTDTVYIATNPVHMIVEKLAEFGYETIPLRDCTDKLRANIGNASAINTAVLTGKGHTFWTPGFAMVKQVMEDKLCK